MLSAGEAMDGHRLEAGYDDSNTSIFEARLIGLQAVMT